MNNPSMLVRCLVLFCAGYLFPLVSTSHAQTPSEIDPAAFEARATSAVEEQRSELKRLSGAVLPVAEDIGSDWRQPWQLPSNWRAYHADPEAYWSAFFEGRTVNAGSGRGLVEQVLQIPGLIAHPFGRELVRLMGSPEAAEAMFGPDDDRNADDVYRQFLGAIRFLYEPMSHMLLSVGAAEYQGYRQLLESRSAAPEGDDDPDLLRLIEDGLASPFDALSGNALQQRLLDTLAMIEGVGVMDYYRSNAWGPPETHPADGRGWLVEGRGVVIAIDPDHADLVPRFTETEWAPLRQDLERLARANYTLLLELTELQTRQGAERARRDLERLSGEHRAAEAQRIEDEVARVESELARAREQLLDAPLGLHRCDYGEDCHTIIRVNNRRSTGGRVQKMLYGWFRVEGFVARAVVAGNAPEPELIDSMDQLLAALHASLAGEAPAELAVLDANPLFTGVDDVAALTPADIAALSTERRGSIADGTSLLLLRWPVEEPGRLICTVVNGQADGRCQPIGVLEHEERHFAAALYRPPNSFGEADGSVPRLDGTVDAREVLVNLRFTPQPREDESEQEAEARSISNMQGLLLARPPVVLVHGTYDWPEKAWDTGLEGRPSLNRRLANAGFKTFLVDYRWSNGSSSSQDTGATLLRAVPDQGSSTFAANRMVVWRDRGHHPGGNNNGIEAALAYFRDELALAATQADVVGHSMGGVLPRVYASANYTGDRYRRPDNFMKGDIHRLITLCSTHFGSDVTRGLIAFESLFPEDFSSGTEYLLARAIPVLADWVAGLKTGAARDQLPESEALQRIGPTGIPSHAMGCIASPADLDAHGGETGRLYTGMTYLFYAFPKLAEEALKAMGQEEDARRLVGISEGIDWNAAFNDATKRGIIEIWPTLAASMRFGGIGVDPLAITDKKLIRALGRAALFGNARNDGVVRLQSQWGGLRRAHRTSIMGVDHSDAPRLAAVQNRIIELLRGSGDAFAEHGFPAAGQPLLSRDPDDKQSVAEKLDVIEDSNIVYTHALAISELAEARREVLIIRPVNSHSTRLIEADEATKGMLVKGKSADWGHQRGFIAVDQAFSKITGPTDSGAADRIARFNCEVLYSITHGIAIPRDFRIRLDGREYDLRRRVEASSGPYENFGCRDEDGKLVAEESFVQEIARKVPAGRRPSLYLRDDRGRYWLADDPETPATGISDDNTLPLRVLADPEDGKYLTADYDLLAIGTREPPGPARNDPTMGNVTDDYVATIEAINEAVTAAGYDGGNVVHHGPESHFTKSEGVDFPDTAFEPTGDIVLLREGPAGQKDRYVKRFFARWKRRGWHLEPNPRWNWGEFDEEIGRWPDEDLDGGEPGPGHPVPLLGPNTARIEAN